MLTRGKTWYLKSEKLRLVVGTPGMREGMGHLAFYFERGTLTYYLSMGWKEQVC